MSISSTPGTQNRIKINNCISKFSVVFCRLVYWNKTNYYEKLHFLGINWLRIELISSSYIIRKLLCLSSFCQKLVGGSKHKRHISVKWLYKNRFLKKDFTSKVHGPQPHIAESVSQHLLQSLPLLLTLFHFICSLLKHIGTYLYQAESSAYPILS